MNQLIEFYVEETKTEAYEQAQALRINALAAQGDSKGITKHIRDLDRYANS